jgi:hypothetical protein
VYSALLNQQYCRCQRTPFRSQQASPCSMSSSCTPSTSS